MFSLLPPAGIRSGQTGPSCALWACRPHRCRAQRPRRRPPPLLPARLVPHGRCTPSARAGARSAAASADRQQGSGRAARAVSTPAHALRSSRRGYRSRSEQRSYLGRVPLDRRGGPTCLLHLHRAEAAKTQAVCTPRRGNAMRDVSRCEATRASINVAMRDAPTPRTWIR